MKLILLVAVLCVSPVLAADSQQTAPPIELLGIASLSNNTSYVLRDRRTGRTAWVRRGEEFSGYCVIRSDTAGGKVTIADGVMEFTITLPEAKVKSARDLRVLMESRHIATDDLTLLLDGGTAARFNVALQDKPEPLRVIEISVGLPGRQLCIRKTPKDAGPITRSALNPLLASLLSDSDLARINERLLSLASKWFRE